MSRDHRKLRVFRNADGSVLSVYHATRSFPISERFGLQAQLRRAALSVAANIVEGSARRSTAEYLGFLNIAAASAAETGYLLGLAGRLGFITSGDQNSLEERYTRLSAELQALIRSLSALSRKPGAGSRKP
jgi:four helix bundle protein